MTQPSKISQEVDFEDQPCIVCRGTEALERRGADVYECNNCHSLYKVTLKGGLRLTQEGHQPTPLQQNLQNVFAGMGVSQDFMAASDHPYDCKCDICKGWWKSMGPDPDTERCGPWTMEELFSKEEIETYREQWAGAEELFGDPTNEQEGD